MSDVDYTRTELPQLENYTKVEPFSRYLAVTINPAIKRICVHTKTKSRLNHKNLHISLWWRTLWWKTFFPYISSQNSNHSLDINFPASILFHFHCAICSHKHKSYTQLIMPNISVTKCEIKKLSFDFQLRFCEYSAWLLCLWLLNLIRGGDLVYAVSRSGQVNFYIRDRPVFAVMVKTVLVWKVKKKSGNETLKCNILSNIKTLRL